MYIIGITGGTASGKTTFVNHLKTRFSENEITIISQDDYYKPLTNIPIKERDLINFDHPETIDFELLHQHISTLKAGNSAEIPTYCFTTHDRLPETKTLFPKKILIIEGILILSQPNIKKECNYTIFIDAPHEIRQERRLKRDVEDRGRSPESVLKQFKENIAPMHNLFVEPSKNNVNLIIDGTKDLTSNVEAISEIIIKQLS